MNILSPIFSLLKNIYANVCKWPYTGKLYDMDTNEDFSYFRVGCYSPVWLYMSVPFLVFKTFVYNWRSEKDEMSLPHGKWTATGRLTEGLNGAQPFILPLVLLSCQFSHVQGDINLVAHVSCCYENIFKCNKTEILKCLVHTTLTSKGYVDSFAEETLNLKEYTTTVQHCLVVSWQIGSAIKMASVLVEQLVTD